MRERIDSARLEQFLERFGRATSSEATVYLTGGACAVLVGWRDSTLDIDLTFEPETGALFEALPALKEALHVNVELASPAHFVPELPGWRDRSPLIGRRGPLTFRHYDFHAQALSKIERGHDRDRLDVAEMQRRGLFDPRLLRELFEAALPQLVRYPAIDPARLRRAVAAVTG